MKFFTYCILSLAFSVVGCGTSSDSGGKGNGPKRGEIDDTIRGTYTLIEDSSDYPYPVGRPVEAQISLEATLYDYQPEGVYDGGESKSIYILVKDSSLLKPGRVDIGHSNYYFVYQEIYDPGGYDNYHQEDLTGFMNILSVDNGITAEIQVDETEYMDSVQTTYAVIFR